MEIRLRGQEHIVPCQIHLLSRRLRNREGKDFLANGTRGPGSMSINDFVYERLHSQLRPNLMPRMSEEIR